MRKIAVLLCLAILVVPAQARRRFSPGISRPATVSGGFSPTTPFGPSGAIAPASTGFSPTCTFGPSSIQPASTGFSTSGEVPNRTLNSGYGVRRGYGRRRGYYRGYYNSGYSNGGYSTGSGIPGYDTPLPQKTLPGY
ncbi:MAG: hypothetical protein U0931_02015 [Vulcanimicrobiota bacterium]